MEIQTLVTYFEQAGGHLILRDGRVKVCYPGNRKEAVAPILTRLREHRAEVAQLLRRRTAKPSPPMNVWARVINGGGIAKVSKAEFCWHCSGVRECKCAVCLARDIEGRDVPGQCRSCLGTGYLTFSEGVACQ